MFGKEGGGGGRSWGCGVHKPSLEDLHGHNKAVPLRPPHFAIGTLHPAINAILQVDLFGANFPGLFKCQYLKCNHSQQRDARDEWPGCVAALSGILIQVKRGKTPLHASPAAIPPPYLAL